MCPLYPLHIVLLYLCLILPLLLAVVQGSEELSTAIAATAPNGNKFLGGGKLTFGMDRFKTQEQNVSQLQLSCYDCHGLDAYQNELKLVLSVTEPDVASLSADDAAIDHQAVEDSSSIVIDLKEASFFLASSSSSNWTMPFNLTGEFLGFTKVKAKIVAGQSPKGAEHELPADAVLPVAVVRKKTIQSKLFSYSVAILVSLAYINMGCAMDLQVVKQTLRKPIGPLIGFACQYVAMPLIAFGLGFVFYDNPAMRLGLFVTGCSPGGGASNIWTVMFGGNLNLSVTMTALSTFAAFVMMPAWIFSLGQHLIMGDLEDQYDIVIPYYKIAIYCFFLVIPLSIGLAVARYLPKVAAFLVKILKPLALFLILFILIFGIWANLYIFKLMNWQVFVAGMGLPWIGFAFGCTLARALKQPRNDIIAIAIETGIQNTGMSIFILWFTLDHPLGDITAVVPVAAATMTPFPLLAALTTKKLIEMYRARQGYGLTAEDPESAPVKDKMDIWKLRENQEGEVPQSQSNQGLMTAVDNSPEKKDKTGCPVIPTGV